MPSSKSSRSKSPAKKMGHKRPSKRPHKPHKSPDDTLIAEPPIVVTSGSVQIDIDNSIFPQDPGNPNIHKNANRRLTAIEIQDLSSPPNSLMTLDLRGIAGGRLKILIKYDK